MDTDQTAKNDTECWLDELDVDPSEARDATHMRRIAAALRARAEAQNGLDDADDALNDAVAAARADGETWAVIGTALGISRQAAYQRFGKVDA